MIIIKEKRAALKEKTTNFRLYEKIEKALWLEYCEAVSNVQTGESPIDESVATTVSMAIDAISKWVHTHRSQLGQTMLAKPTSAFIGYQWNSSLDKKLEGMEKILKQARTAIERYEN